MRPLLVVALLLGLAFASVPAADAKPVPPGPCYEKSYVDNGMAHVYTTLGCATFVDLLETECFWGGHWTTVASAGNVYVRTWSCSPESADMAASPACASTSVASSVVDVTLANTCQVYVDEHAGTFFTCDGTVTSNSEEHRDVGPVHATADSCRVHLPPCACDPVTLPVEPSAASCTCDPNPWLLIVAAVVAATPCLADAITYAVYHGPDVNPVAGDCVVDAYPPYECVGGWGADRTVALGFVRVVVRVCTGGPLPPIVQ
jgi:hypothetical protein